MVAAPSASGPSRRTVLSGVASLASALVGSGTSEGATPTRIICLEWTAAELVLTLGIEPVAVGDVRGYRDWVVEPALPAGVRDLGTRFEPNLELLMALRPDLVIATQGYGAGPQAVRGLAPVVEITPNPGGSPPFDHAEAQLRQIAALVGRSGAAEAAIEETRAVLRQAHARLLEARPAADRADPVCIVSLFEGRSVRVYGAAGLVGAVMQRIGLRNAWTDPVNRWGFASVGVERLARLEPSTRVIAIDPITPPVRALLAASSLWTNMPFIRANRFARIPPIWPYGGVAAAARLSGALVDVLSDARAG